jgi:hypothetical protein
VTLREYLAACALCGGLPSSEITEAAKQSEPDARADEVARVAHEMARCHEGPPIRFAAHVAAELERRHEDGFPWAEYVLWLTCERETVERDARIPGLAIVWERLCDARAARMAILLQELRIAREEEPTIQAINQALARTFTRKRRRR